MTKEELVDAITKAALGGRDKERGHETSFAAKSEPDRLLDSVGDSFAALGGGVNRSKLVKAGLIAGGVAATHGRKRRHLLDPAPHGGERLRETASCRSGRRNVGSGRN